MSTGSERRTARLVALVAIVTLTAVACNGSDDGSAPRPGATAAPSGVASSTTSTPGPCDSTPVTPRGGAGQSTYVANADVATGLAFAPDGRLFFTERSGAIRIATPTGVSTLTTLETVTTERGGGYSERGLLDLALSPTFSRDHLLYVFVSRPDYATQSVVRISECVGQAGSTTEIVTLPSGSGCCHKGGRIAFGPDGKLYVTLGDNHAVPSASVDDPASVPQDPSDPRGKILRYNPDGTIPADNPFGPTSAVWATGFRNPYGLAFAPDGTAFVTDNGPTGDAGSPSTGYDLAFRVKAGDRRQWPACYGYGHPIRSSTTCLGRPDPEWSSEAQAVVPTGATWVDSGGPSGLAGRFVFCTYFGGLRVFEPGSPRATVTSGADQCRYDVTQGPDRALYFSDGEAIHRLA